MSTRHARGAKVLGVIVLTAAAMFIAACGGSSSTRSATAPGTQSAANEASSAAAAKAHRDVVIKGVVTQRPLRGTGGGEINDDNPGKADSPSHTDTNVRAAAPQSDPCMLVSSSEAQTILGRPIDSPVQAPLGPTCIYQARGAKSFITLAVESIDFAKIKARISKRMQFNVRGRTGYCGVFGQPTTFVPLASGRVLSIIAPCGIGIRFAGKALPRVRT
jgi:hypothetical protein